MTQGEYATYYHKNLWIYWASWVIVEHTCGASSVSFLSVDVVVGWWGGCSFASFGGGLVGVCSTSIASSSSPFFVPSTLKSSPSLFFTCSSIDAGGKTLAATVAGGFAGSSTFFATE